jgi:UDP-N-acetylglucosamine 2-epimerase (non-hydrolysing)
MLIDLVVGTRPNIVKLAAILYAYQEQKNLFSNVSLRVIHTGQHYDRNLSGSFFEQLQLPMPDIQFMLTNTDEFSALGEIIDLYYAELIKKRPHLTLVFGDVNSTLAATIAAKRAGVKVGHVEAGIRSRDILMPEEQNRLMVDALADYFYVTTELAMTNLKAEGIAPSKIFLVGNTMVDTLKYNLKHSRRPEFMQEENSNFVLLTMHRPSNVDEKLSLFTLMSELSELLHDKFIVFPIHPRTRKLIDGFEFADNFLITPPQPYLEFLWLLKNCSFVITDSGGISEETTILRKPCFTLRSNTERPETVLRGTNKLIGNDLSKLKSSLSNLGSTDFSRFNCDVPLWDGFTGKRILNLIKRNHML